MVVEVYYVVERSEVEPTKVHGFRTSEARDLYVINNPIAERVSVKEARDIMCVIVGSSRLHVWELHKRYEPRGCRVCDIR
jgi:hypothetical protein